MISSRSYQMRRPFILLATLVLSCLMLLGTFQAASGKGLNFPPSRLMPGPGKYCSAAILMGSAIRLH